MHFYDDDPDREERRRRFRRNLPWIAPLGVLGAAALFFGLGQLVVWLWRVTVVDLFAWKAISFWQAWGLILLSQILFKANVRPVSRTGRWPRRGPWRGAREAQPEPTA